MCTYRITGGLIHGVVDGTSRSFPWNGDPEKGLAEFRRIFPNTETPVYETHDWTIEAADCDDC